MSDRQETTLFVASADGTAMEPLPRTELRRRLDARLLRWTQQVWCPDEGKWKPAREVARLAAPAPPASAPSPTPTPRVVAVKQPSVVQPAPSPRVSVVQAPTKVQVAAKARVAPAPAPSPAPKAVVAAPRPQPAPVAKPAPVRVPTPGPAARAPSAVRAPSAAKAAPALRAAASVVRAPSSIATAPSPVPGAAAEAPAKAWHQRNSTVYGIGSLVLVLALVGMNWLGAAVPARRAVADAGLDGKVVVRAHCAFYVQPGGLILTFEQLPEDLPSEKFVDLLTALAVRNPTSTLFFAKYDGVALVKDGQVRYRLRGDAWEALAKMKDEVVGRRAMMLINYLYDAKGKPVLDQKEDRMEYLQGQKEKALRDFLGAFLKIEGTKRPAAPASPAP